MDEGLPGDVERGIVEVLGGECGGVDGGEARVVTVDAMLLNEAHPQSPPALAPALALASPALPGRSVPTRWSRSCAWLVAAHRATRTTRRRWQAGSPPDPLAQSPPH